jgi:hypothetical protein
MVYSPSRVEGVACEAGRGSASLKTNSHSGLDPESLEYRIKLKRFRVVARNDGGCRGTE